MSTRLILPILLMLSLAVLGQESLEPKIQQISPLTPNAAALGKFGNTPVSLYTGIPSIQIPIYEVKVRDFSLPISLNYHAGGVKVDDVASWVGMGWSLNAGGMISRQQRGTHDYKMINNKSSFYSHIETILSPTSTDGQKADAAFLLKSNEYDTESDIFSINAGSLSQKFFMDVDANIFCMPARKLEITPESSYFSGHGYEFYARWRVKDEKGIEYIFGKTSDNTKEEFEITQSNQVCGSTTNNPENVSSWYLNEIILPTGESIKFTYDYFSFCVESSVSETFTVESIEWSSSNTATKYLKALRIKEITFPSGKVEFVAGDLRRDFAGTNVLDEIKIYAKEAGTYEFIKSFSLDTNNPDGNLTSGDESFRLALLSVTEKDKDGNALEPYTFNYKNQTWDSYSFKLAARGSKAQDIWGYHNGQVNNTSLIPNFLIRNGSGQIIGDVSGANRAVDTEHAKAGILEKITYPTKGSTELFYESNVAKGATDSNDPNAVNPVEQLLNMDIRATEMKMNNTWLLNTTGSDEKYGPTFEIYHEAGVSVDFDSHIFYFDDNNQCTTTTPGGVGSFFECMDISLEKKNSSDVFVSINNTVYFDRSYHLDPGEYRIKLVWDDNSQTGSYGYVDLSWTDLADPPAPVINDNTEMVVGGLRISKIVDHDPVSNDDIIRNYNYTYDATDSPLTGSSGLIQNAPLHLYTKPYAFNDQGVPTICACQFLTSFSNSPILQTSGGYVGYEKVTVTYGATGEGGKQVSTFLSPKDHIDENISESQIWPFNRTTSLDWRRGLNESATEYKYTSGGDVEVSSKNSNYAFNNNIIDPNYKNLTQVKVDLYPIIDPPPTAGIHYKGTYNIYHTKTESFHQSQTIDTQHHISGDIASTTNYYYDNDDHLQLTRTETTNSDGELLKTKMSYAHDVNDQTLKDQNRIAEPVKVESFIKKGTNPEEKLVERNTIYSSSGTNYLPSTIQTAKDGGSLEDRVLYTYHTASGNVKEVHKADGAETVYLWGYNKQYPIAKIDNATFSEVESAIATLNTSYNTLAEIQALSNADDDRTVDGIDLSGTITYEGTEGALRAALAALRSALPNSMVSTYTYDPLIGVTSMTDSSGYTSYYDYDAFNRLHYVKNANGHILSKNEYHYKGQQ